MMPGGLEQDGPYIPMTLIPEQGYKTAETAVCTFFILVRKVCSSPTSSHLRAVFDELGSIWDEWAVFCVLQF